MREREREKISRMRKSRSIGACFWARGDSCWYFYVGTAVLSYPGTLHRAQKTRRMNMMMARGRGGEEEELDGGEQE